MHTIRARDPGRGRQSDFVRYRHALTARGAGAVLGAALLLTTGGRRTRKVQPAVR